VHKILECDRMSTADQRERSKRDEKRSRHELSFVPRSATGSTGAGDLILANDKRCERRFAAAA